MHAGSPSRGRNRDGGGSWIGVVALELCDTRSAEGREDFLDVRQ